MRSYCRLKRIFILLSVVAVFALAGAATGDAFAQGTAKSAWPCRGYHSGRTGQSPYVGAQSSTLKWKYQIADKIYSSPAIGVDGTIYIAGLDSKLYALRPDGSLIWKYQATDKIYSSPAIGADGTIYVGSYDGKVHAINPDGSQKWVSQTGYQTESSPAIGADGTVYIGNHDGKIYALRANDGQLMWASQTAPLYMYSSPAIGPDSTVYVAAYDGRLYAFSPDGTICQDYQISENSSLSPLVGLAIGADHTIYVASDDGAVYALWLNGNNCILKWKFQASTQFHSSPAIGNNGLVYIGSHNGQIYAIKPDGKLKWSYPTGGAIYSSPAIGADGTIYIGSTDGRIYALRPDGSLVWSYRTRAQIYSSPAIGEDGTLYVGSYDYRLYAFSAIVCQDNGDCSAGGGFCQYGVGDCTGQGVCSNLPKSCPDVFDPVCGCDGLTYDNWCQAAAHSVSVAYQGVCGVVQEQGEEVCDGKDNDLDGLVDEDLTRPCSTAYGSGTESCQAGQWVGCTAPQPQGEEVCDGKDNDLDGLVDEDLTRACSTACGSGTESCQGGQWVGCTAPQPQDEVCDGLDNDCDGLVDEDLTRPCSTACGSGTEICQGGQWVGCTASQPQDEVCDGLDNDCDGLVDEDLTRACSTACGSGTEICQGGQWVGCTAPQPQDEVCDGLDNDCDGLVDEEVMNTYYADKDGDGYGNPSVSIQACSPPSGFVSDSSDCNDEDWNIHPGTPEIPCNGQDEDCLGGDSTLVCSSYGQAEDESGQLDIQGTTAKASQNKIMVPVRIQSAPNEIHVFGFEVIYDPRVLTYSENFEPGELASAFSIFEVKPLCPGRIWISGASPEGEGIVKGASGYLVWLEFKTVDGQENQGHFLQLENLDADLIDFSTTGGILTVLPRCNGDVDGDGKIGIQDVSIVFNCYLKAGPCPECADVNQDGSITMADVLCLSAKSTGQPSCLDRR